VSGSRQCQTPEGGQQYCAGSYIKCTINAAGEPPTCVTLDPSTVTESTNCYDGYGYRYTTHYVFSIVDFSDPANPKVVPNKITFPAPDEAVNARTEGNTLLVTVKNQASLPGDPRPYAKHYLKRVDLTNPSQPVIDAGINLPGYPIDTNGTKIVTRDRQWGSMWQDQAIAYVQIKGNVAELQNYKKFEGRDIVGIVIDDHDTAVVSSRSSWYYYWYYKQGTLLDILTPQKQGAGFDLQSQTPIENWMGGLFGGAERRLFFSVYGGTLIANIDDLKKPVAQAFFPVYYGNSRPVIHKGDILAAGGRLGVFQVKKNASNLLTTD
jgi:hypothetical protein